jgi:hypothetical protein
VDDREFWVQVRRGLLTIVIAIGKRFDLPLESRSIPFVVMEYQAEQSDKEQVS